MSNLQIYIQQLEAALLLAQKAQVLNANQVPTFAALPYGNYKELLDALEDLQDLMTMEQARLEDDGTRIPIEDVMREFGL